MLVENIQIQEYRKQFISTLTNLIWPVLSAFK